MTLKAYIENWDGCGVIKRLCIKADPPYKSCNLFGVLFVEYKIYAQRHFSRVFSRGDDYEVVV